MHARAAYVSGKRVWHANVESDYAFDRLVDRFARGTAVYVGSHYTYSK